MKKSLLTLAAAFAVVGANAADLAFELDFATAEPSEYVSAYTKTFTATCNGNKFTVFAMNNNTVATPWTEVRAGRKNNASTPYIATAFAASEVIEKIDFNITQLKAADAALILKTTLYTSATVDFADAVATEVPSPTGAGVFTVEVPAPAADLYYKVEFETSDKGSGNGYLRLSKVSYYGDAAVGSLPAAGLSFPESSYTAILGNAFTAPELTKETTAAVSYTSSNEDVATVDAATGEITLVDAGTTTITASAEANDDFRAGNASYTLTVVKAYTSVEEFYTLPSKGTGLIGFDLTVTYVNGNNCYATDGITPTLIYGSTSYKVGDIIPSGWTGQYSPFSQLPEIAPASAMPEVTETTEVTYPTVTEVSLDDVNLVCVLSGVTFEEATATGSTKVNFKGLVGEKEYTFRNNFADVESVEPGTYDVTLAVARYNTTLQLYPIAYAPHSDSVDSIEVADEAVEYFNLQGVRVANPENGLYIRRQGSKVSKVLVK